MNKKATKSETKRGEKGRYLKGTKAGPGRKIETTEEKLIKKAQKELIKDYVQILAEALPKISPVLIAKAIQGDMQAIKEINDRVMGKPQTDIDIKSDGKRIPFGNLNEILRNNGNIQNRKTG